MTNKHRSDESGLLTDISEDVIAEALRSVEKHQRRRRSDDHPSDPLSDEEEQAEHVGVPEELARDLAGLEPESTLLEFPTPSELTLEEPRQAAPVLELAPHARVRDAHAPNVHAPNVHAPNVHGHDADQRRIEFLKKRTVELTREVTRLEQAFAEKTIEAQRSHDRLLWMGAELENSKKRAARERTELEKFGLERFLRELLPVLDNLERALRHARETPELGVLRDGVSMTLTQFSTCLRRFGVQRIDLSPGKPFDPTVHEAMMHEESGELPPNTVVREMLSGYLLQERLLRPSLVTVARRPMENTASLEIVEEDGQDHVVEPQAASPIEPSNALSQDSDTLSASAGSPPDANPVGGSSGLSPEEVAPFGAGASEADLTTSEESSHPQPPLERSAAWDEQGTSIAWELSDGAALSQLASLAGKTQEVREDAADDSLEPEMTVNPVERLAAESRASNSSPAGSDG